MSNEGHGLNKFYNLRRDFIIIGLTGKMQAGADSFVNILKEGGLCSEKLDFLKRFQNNYSKVSRTEALKIRRIRDFFEYDDNWKQFSVIEYKNVVLLFMLKHCYDNDSSRFAENVVEWIIKLGTYKEFDNPRFGSDKALAKGSKAFLEKDFKRFLKRKLDSFDEQLKFLNSTNNLSNSIKTKSCNNFFFSSDYSSFAKSIFDELDSFSVYLRHRLIHVVSYCLRRFGSLDIDDLKDDSDNENLDHIYIIADVINQIIKSHRSSNDDKVHIIIDRLKNSYEMMYFREKYGGFYAVANNREEVERRIAIENKLKCKAYSAREAAAYVNDNLSLIKALDENEYKIDEFKKGKFHSFDIENCVQKADYHLWNNEEQYDSWGKEDFDIEKTIENLPKTNEYYIYPPYIIQVLKFIALIQQPGLIVPTYPERVMQIAFNAKLNSGCISRQVGAVVTDKHFSVKGIGWNEVPQGQVPCSLRDLRDLVVDKNIEQFTQFERGASKSVYVDNKNFNNKIKEDFNKIENVDEKLKGRACSFCFKTFHNKYKGEDNQVHTRSLHAEENAMLQIAKYGGQPLSGGNLFTTASPCELCSKKAYQLGIKNIFYIDLYPGISEKHILKGGMKKSNPILYRYQGAIGKGYQKLYEPFMSVKDETNLITGLKPTEKPIDKNIQIKEILNSEMLDEEKKELINTLKDFVKNNEITKKE